MAKATYPRLLAEARKEFRKWEAERRQGSARKQLRQVLELVTK